MPAGTVPRKLKVFLSYSRPDQPRVLDLYHRLLNEGHQPWLDEEDLLPGEEWVQAIGRAVRSSDIAIVCLSPQSITRQGFVHREIRMVLEMAEEMPEGTIFLIPARLEECAIPERLSKFHGVDLWQESGYGRLRQSLRIRADHLGLLPPESPRAAAVSVDPLHPWIGVVLEKKRTGGAYLNLDCRLTNRSSSAVTIDRILIRLTDPFNTSFEFPWRLFYKTEGLLQTKESDAHPVPLQAGEAWTKGIQFAAPRSVREYTWDAGRYAINVHGWLAPAPAGAPPDFSVPFEAFISDRERRRLRGWTKEYEEVKDPNEAVLIPVDFKPAARAVTSAPEPNVRREPRNR